MNGDVQVLSVSLYVPDLDCPSNTQQHIFKLGDGPCGWYVQWLTVRFDGAGVYITQHSTRTATSDDSKRNEFFYPHTMLRGRVNIVHKLLL